MRTGPQRVRCVLLLALGMATQAAADDAAFVAQWPLTLESADAGAHQVELDATVYVTAVSPRLRDVVIVNADGRQVPALLQSAPPPAAERRTRALSWFPLPASAARPGSDITSISELDIEGRLRRVQWAPGGDDAAPVALLVDATAADAPVEALALAWDPSAAPFERALRVEGSDDLRQWRPLPAGARLLDLQRDGARLVERRIVFDTLVRERYLRVTPGAGVGAMPTITGVSAESTVPGAAAELQWRTLEVDAQADGSFVYRLDARVPVTHVDLGLAGNATARWSLSARDDAQTPWRTLAGDWLVYRVGADATPPLALDAPVRMREWRLQAEAASPGAPPALRLGYRPERLVFVAEGPGPFALRAGSARTARNDAPVAPLLADLRARNGADWQPAAATLGARTELAGATALDDTPTRDWGTWLLWGVLLLGVLLIGGFALSLLRAPKSE